VPVDADTQWNNELYAIRRCTRENAPEIISIEQVQCLCLATSR
jgi:hypothetical protein